MLNRNRELALCSWTAAAVSVIALTDNLALRSIAAVPLVFFLPGYALSRALGLEQKSPMEQVIFAMSGSMAATVAGGFALAGVNCLNLFGWSIWFSAVTVIAAGIAAIRGVAPFSPLWPRQPLAGFRFHHGVSLVAATLIVFSALSIAARDESQTRQFHFTEFWMVPADREGVQALTIGIRNAEVSTSVYEIEVMLDGQLVSVRRSKPLQPGETVTKEIAVPPTSGRGHKMEAWLFKDGNRNRVYRKVSVVVDDKSGA